MEWKTDKNSIIEKMAELLGFNKEAESVPKSLEEFKKAVAKAENEGDCKTIEWLKEHHDRVSMNPELAFTIALNALNRCKARQNEE